jgi:uncharacterized delta-60 repeat protein
MMSYAYKKTGFRKIAASLLLGVAWHLLAVNCFAEVSVNDGFDPNANGTVYSIALQPDGKILMGGAFTTIGGTTRNYITRLNADGSLDTTFNPDANDSVRSIALQPDGKIITGGNFTYIGGTARNRIARLNADGSLDTTFNPNADNSVGSIALQPDGKIIVGGNFTNIAGTEQNRIARLNADGSLDAAFNPNANGIIYSIAHQPDGKIITGGNFTYIGGTTRNSIARLNADGNIDTTFNPDANSNVYSIILQPDGKIIIGGDFSSVGVAPRYNIARLNADGSLDATFDPNANSTVYSIALQPDGKIIVGGQFTTIGGVPRYNIARLNSDSSLDTALTPNANGNIYSITFQPDGKILIGGYFNTVGGNTRNCIARLNVDGSLDTTLYQNANDSVWSITLQPDGKIITGGHFTTVGGTWRNHIARLDANGGLDTTFNPDANNNVYSITLQTDGKILIGGYFTTVGGIRRNHIARLNADGSLGADFNPDANGDVYSITLQPDGKILIGGYFTTVGGTWRYRIARLNTDGSLDTTFTPPDDANGTVYSITLQSDGKIIIGGYFTTIGGTTRNYIARLNANGSLDADFNPNANSTVYSVALQPSGKIIIGGEFTTIGGTARNYIARLNADGSLDADFNPDANGDVYSITLQTDGKIIIGGDFTTIGGTAQNHIARLNADGSLDTTFNPNAGNTVYSIVLQTDGKIIIGGGFTTIGGVERNHIARLSNDSAAIQSLSISTDGTAVTWARSGSGPEVYHVVFEQSPDVNTWTSLGTAARIDSGWQLTGLSLPFYQNRYIRARGATIGGSYNSSQGILESVALFYCRILTVTKTGSGSGTVTSSPSDIACGSDCSASYNQGTSVTLTAVPNSGFVFIGWSGGGCTGTGICTVTMDSAKTVTAEFADTIAPTGYLLINGGDNYTKSPFVTLALSASDESGVWLMRFSEDNVFWTDPESYNTSRSWTLSADDGIKTVYVKFMDTLENWSNAYFATISVDTTAPTGVSAGGNKAKNAEFTQTGTATDATSPMTYEWMRDSGPGEVIFGIPNALSTTISATANGTYILRFTATDATGNSTSSNMTLLWDTVPPYNVSAGANKTKNAQFIQTGYAADSTSQVTFAWTKLSGPGTITFGTPNNYNTTIAASLDGVYTIRLTATDAAGNSASSDMTLVWDTTPPTGVSAGDNQIRNAQFTQTGTATDTNAMTHAWTKVSGPGTITFGTATALSTTVSASADGSYVLRFTATDAAGNSSYSDMTLVWDTTPPSGVSAGGNQTKNAQFTQTGTATDTNAMAYAWTKVSGPGAITFGAATTPETTVSASIDGTYVLRFTATDAAGNSSYSDTTLVWDTTPPTGVSAGSNKTKNVEFTQTGTATDANSITYAWTKLTGPGAITFGTPNAISTTISATLDGTYTLRLTATDAGGNSTYGDMTLVWDTTPPTGVSAGANKTKNAEFTQAGVATDASGMTYSWTKLSGPGAITFGTPNAISTIISAALEGIYTIRFIALDAAGNSSSSDMTLVWDTTAPTGVSAGSNKTKNAEFTQTGTAIDVNVMTYAWTQLTGPGIISFETPNATSTTISATLDGSYTIRFTATDAAGNNTSSDMTLVWDTTPPIGVSAGGNRTKNVQFTQTGTATDTNGITYSWAKLTGPGVVTFGTPTAISTTISATLEGTYMLRFTATDAAGNSSYSDMVLVWDTTAPTGVSAGGDKTKNGLFTQTGAATDASNMTYSWMKLTGPGAITFGTPNAFLTTVAATLDGTYSIRFTATDAAGNSSYSDMTLIWDTAPPTGVSAGGDKMKNAEFTQTGTAADTNGMTYVWTKLTGSGAITFGTPTAISTTISATLEGTYILRFIATDAAGNSSYSDMVLVWDTTAPTGVSAGGDKTKNGQFTQTGTATDANSMSYTWTRLTGPGTITFGMPNALSTTISASLDGTYIIRLTVTDAASNSSYSDMNLIWDTTAPTNVSAGVNQTRNAEFIQTGTAIDANNMTYAWTKLTGPGIITFGTPNAISTTISAAANGTYTLSFTATDAAGNSSSGNMTLIWDATAPTNISAGGDKTKNGTYTQTGTATDANGMTYSWTQLTGPGTITFGTPDASSTTISATTNGTYILRFTVSDIAGNSSYNDMTLVWDTSAPTVSIGAPSATFTNIGPVTYTVTYTGASAVSLDNSNADDNVTLITTGNAAGTVAVSGTGSSTRNVTISGITGNGTLGISLASGTATDEAGNLAASVGPSATFVVDNVAPTTSANPQGGTFNSLQNVGLSANETATIYYTIDGSDPTTSSSAYIPGNTISIPATKTLKFRALDLAGNLEQVKTEVYVISTVGPTGSISGPTWINSQEVTVSLEASDPNGVTHMRFSFDNFQWSDPEDFSAQRTFTPQWTDGTRYIYAKFQNSLGSWSNAYTYKTVLDTAKPTGSVAVTGGALGTTSQTISLTLSASDGTSGVQQVGFSNDGLNYTWVNYGVAGQSMNWLLTEGQGQKTVHVKYRDAAGNESEPCSVQITFDTETPVPVISSPVSGLAVTSLDYISGLVTDALPSSGIAKIEIRLTDGLQFLTWNGQWTATDSFFTLTSGEINGSDCYHFTRFSDWVLDKTYTITIRAADNAGNSADTTSTVTFVAGDKAYTTLSLWPTSQTIIGGGTLGVSGTLDRPGATINLKDRPIKLTITDPDNKDQTLDTTTYDKAGHYEIKTISGFNKKGTWTLKASFDGSASLDAAETTKTVLVGNTAGYAILIQGKISDTDTDGIASHNKTTNRIYKKLLERGFDATNIRYFNYNTNQEGVYNTPTKADKASGVNTDGIIKTIKEWARDRIISSPAPLYIIMVNHGNPGIFHLGSSEKITPTELASWLNTLEGNLKAINAAALQEKRIIIIGACYSGSFISELSKPATTGAPNRIVITSAADNEESYRGPNEPGGRSGEYFLEEFFIQLGRGYSLKKSFDYASQKTEEYTRKGGMQANATNQYFDHSVQHPLLEDDGNLVGSNKLSEGQGDGVTAATLFFGAGTTYTNSANNPAEIIKVTDTVYLDADPSSSHSTATLTLKTNVDTYGVDNAWVEIRSPNKILTPSGSGSMQLVIDLTQVPMTSADENGNWAVTYNGFTESGMYEILYFVRDKETGKISPMKRSTVYKGRSNNAAPCGTMGCPSQFHLLSPDNNKKQKTTLVFSWEDTVDPDLNPITYNLVIAEDNKFNTIVYRKEGIVTTMTYVDNAANLKDPMTYYWMVEAVDSYGAITTSYEKWSFQTDNTNGYPGIITGIVYSDRDFSRIATAMITATIGDSPITIKDGMFILPANAEKINITGKSSGYQDTTLSDVPVRLGEATVVNLSLSPAIVKGDINGGGTVEIGDAILALQVLSRISPVAKVYKSADVNNDGEIGLPEVIYIMQGVAGLRQP